MQLYKLIGEIGAKYDRQQPASSEAHGLLRQAETEFRQWIPSAYLVEAGGKGKSAVTPRIAIFHPDETTTTRHGIHVAYLFAADRSTVTLTLNQGVGEMADHLGRAGARMVLALEASAIRAALRPKDIADLDLTFDLATTATSSVDSQHANIVSRSYRLDSLPSESEMVADLERFIKLYALALEAREVARRHGRQERIAPTKHQAAKTTKKKSPERDAEPLVASTTMQAEPDTGSSAKPVGGKLTLPSLTRRSTNPDAKASLLETEPAQKEPVPSKKERKRARKESEAAAKEPQPLLVKEPPSAKEPETSAKEPERSDKASEPSDKGPEPEIRIDLKRKRLTRAMTRRGVLAALVAAPVVYLTPTITASRAVSNSGPITPVSVPKLPGPLFTIDVSQHDWRRQGGNLDWVKIRQAGIAGMCARATYGDPTGVTWATYHFGDFARAAKQAGMGLRGGYHNVVRGDQASINRQVDWFRRELDRHEATWAMLDVERYAELVKIEMWPRWEDVRRFDDRWAEVDDRVLVGYIPPWNWSKHLGQPDLREFRGPLIASNYPLQNANEDFKQLYDKVGGNDGRGWAAYGSRVPEGWQYSSRAKVPGAPYICDINAWRVTYEQLRDLLIGKRQGVSRTLAQPDV